MTTLQKGYGISKYRSIRAGKYLFLQVMGSDSAEIVFMPKGILTVSLNANFDPTRPERGIWGYPPPFSGITTVQWSELCKAAELAISPLGGLAALRDLPIEDHYFRVSDGREVAQEEATLAPSDPAWKRMLADAFEKAGLRESDPQDLDGRNYTNAEMIRLFESTPWELLALLKQVEPVTAKRNILSFFVKMRSREGSLALLYPPDSDHARRP